MNKTRSFLPINRAASVPPTIAIREFKATSPLIDSIAWADITLNPNQPTVSIHAPNAKNGMLEGGYATMSPLDLYLPNLGPNFITATMAIHPPIP